MLRGQIDMPRKPALVCQSTITKVIKGALKAGAKVSRIEVRPDGSFTIFNGMALWLRFSRTPK
jgi:hypothetical protein